MMFRRFLAAALLAISLAGCAGSFAPPATALVDDHLVAAPVAAVKAEALPQAVSAADVEATLAYLQQTRMVALAGQQRVYLYGNSFNPVLNLNFSAGNWAYGATSFTVPGTGQAITFSQTTLTTMFGADGLLTFGPNNQLTNSATLSTETKTVAPNNMILSFYGTGSVTASGVASFTLNGTGALNQVYRAFTPTAGSLTLTVSGSVTSAVLASVTHETTPRSQDQVITGASAYYGPRDDNGCQYPTTIANCGLLIEQASANEEPNARDMTQASWTKGATITVAHTAIGIDGVANSANLITGGATTATNTVCGALTITSEAQTGSFYIQPVTVTGAINISINGGSTWTNIAGSLISSKFVRPSAEATLANPSLCVQVANNNDQIIVDANQVEDLAFPTSFIPTSLSQVSRAADVATATLPASAALGGTMQVDVMWPSLAAAESNGGALAVAVSKASMDNNNIVSASVSAGKPQGYIEAASSLVINGVGASLVVPGATYRTSIAWGNQGLYVFNNGTRLATAAGAVPTSLAKIYFGTGANSVNGWLPRLFINAPPLSQSRAQQQNSVNQ